MFTTKFFALVALAATFANAATLVQQAQPASDPGAQDLSGTETDSDAIASTAANIDQKAGAANDTQPPDHPPPPTTVTASDGDIGTQSINGTSRRSLPTLARRIPGRFSGASFGKRDVDGFEQLFAGSGTGPNDRDASIQGTAYMTFTTVNNSTYNVKDCVDWCSNIVGCVFVNLFYELNNPGLDASSSNLKCAAYADVHSAAEKTNFGGQQLYPEGQGGLTYIQDSSGWGALSLEEPATPDGYELVFGPTNGANNAPGYMGFAFLSQYDVQACADLCDTRGEDPNGGVCQFFNIWRAVVNGNPTTYTCSMYFVPSDASTAVNTGQGDLQVTFSRGYTRINHVTDGGFEGFPCSSDFCFAESYANWIGTSPAGGHWDALIFSYAPYAHSGNGVGALGSGDGSDNLAGTLKPASNLNLEPGQQYTLQLFHNSNFNGDLEANSFVDVIWNGVIVNTIRDGNSPWKLHIFTVTAKGNGADQLSFHGGAYPAYDFIDDIGVFRGPWVP